MLHESRNDDSGGRRHQQVTLSRRLTKVREIRQKLVRISGKIEEEKVARTSSALCQHIMHAGQG